MYPHYVLLFLAYHVVTGLSLPATYDQRQSGDLNVQVHLKDVQVLALLDSELLDDYTEYDYFYDYADFTVKPIVKPTTSTTTTIASTSSTAGTTEKVDASAVSDSSLNNSMDFSLMNGSQNTNFTTEDATIPMLTDVDKKNETTVILTTNNTDGLITTNNTLKTTISDKTKNLFDDNDEHSAEEVNRETSTGGPLIRSSKKRCRTGYSPNAKGRCRRLSQRRSSLIPLALKLTPKLLDDVTRTAKDLAQKEVHRMHSD